MTTSFRLIVGLGNPGDEYAATRHNIGFMAADALAAYLRCLPWKAKFKGLITSCSEPSLLLLKPMTYMNVSGEAVGEAARFHKLVAENIIVIHDDLDLEPGQVKIKQGGGSGGHNGLKSIDQHIGQNYWRIRIGIGHPGVKGDVVLNYVLGNFAKADYQWVEPILNAIAHDFPLMLEGKTADYLNRIAQATATLS